ncbi:MAG: hypothetical protein FWH20_01755 [Oscillospiraceae bacterium]|nr:hypothetical protein [Oscillospiraceae bacterium]
MISRITNIKNDFLKYTAYRIYTQKTRFIILCVAGALGFPLFGVAVSVMSAAERAIDSGMGQDNPAIQIFFMISSILFVLSCAVMAITAYSGGINNYDYFNRRERVDLNFSLPVKAKHRFWGDFVAGILPVAVIYSFSAILGTVIISIGTRHSYVVNPGDYTTSIGVFITAIIVGLLFLIALYIISIFCATLCGRVYDSFVYPVLICIIIPSLIALVGVMVFNGAWQVDIVSQLSTALFATSPFGFLVGGGVTVVGGNALNWTAPIYDETTTIFTVIADTGIFFKPSVMLPFVLIHGAFLTAAYWFAKRRKAESTGQAFISKIASEILISLVMFCVVAVFAYAISQNSELTGGLLFGMIITSAILFLSLDVTIKRRFTKMGLALLRYAIMIAVSGAISAAILAANGFGIGEYVPPLADIESVSLFIDSTYDHDELGIWTPDSYSYSERQRITFTEPQNIEALRKIHLASNSARDRHMIGVAKYTYTLKSGRIVQRNVLLYADEANLTQILASNEYKRGKVNLQREILALSDYCSMSVTMSDLTGQTELFSSDRNSFIDTERIYAALMQDYLAETYEQRYYTTETNLGIINIFGQVFEEVRVNPHSGSRSAMGLGNISTRMVVRPHFTNLIAELERQGLQITSDPADTFTVYKHELYLNRTLIGYKHNWFTWYNGDLREDRQVVYTEETAALIAELFTVAQPAYIVNGEGFTFSVFGCFYVVPPQHEDVAKRLWDMAYGNPAQPEYYFDGRHYYAFDSVDEYAYGGDDDVGSAEIPQPVVPEMPERAGLAA